MDYSKLAQLLFPDVDKTPEEYESIYPVRDLPPGAMVTRIGPSPTGFVHLGNLYNAVIGERLARQSGGVFILRVEDTDEKYITNSLAEQMPFALAAGMFAVCEDCPLRRCRQSFPQAFRGSH